MTDQSWSPTAITGVGPIGGEPWTELGCSNRLADQYGDRLRFVGTWSRWLAWDGTRWKIDDTGEAARCGKAVARALTDEAKAMPDPADQRAALRIAQRLESSSGVRGIVGLAASHKQLVVTHDQLDVNPFLLNCENGTLNLTDMTIRPHNPADLLTKVAGTSYDPGESPGKEWPKFLDRVQPDPEMRYYLARLAGHAIEGRVTEHLLPIFAGTGANGKSTFVNAVVAALGDYAAPADPDLLTARSFDAHPTSVADLHGKRLAVLHETDQGRRLAEATVKRLTGGDELKARRMREDFWSFKPSHTFLMLTNHKPVVSGTDEGIWRRLRLIPWDIVVPAADRDEHLGDKLSLELAAVLSWLIDGYKDFTRNGLSDPDQVTAATSEYRAESDILSRFLDQRCILGPNFHVRSSELYEAWSKWCANEGDDPGKQTGFSLTLTNRGFDKRRGAIGQVWDGIGLSAESDRE